MAESKPIQSEELIEKGIFTDAKKEAKELNTAIEVLTISFSELVKIQKDGLANIKKIGGATDAKSLKATQEELNKVTEARKKAQEVDKVRLEFTKKFEAQRKKEFEDFQKQKKNSDEYIKAQAVQALTDKARIARLKATAILENQQIGLEQKLLATNTLLRLDRAALVRTDINYGEQLKRINSELDANNELIKNNSDKQKQQSLNVGNYSESVQDALEKTGLFGGVIGKVTQFVELYEASIIAINGAQKANTVATEVNAEAHIANSAAIKTEEAATQKLSLAKRAFNAITSPAGIAIAVGAAILALTKYIAGINKAFGDFFDLIGAKLQDLVATGNEFEKLKILTIAYRDSINRLNQELQILQDNEGDLLARYNDSTLALGIRKKALQDYNKAAIEAKEKAVEIAQQELDIANQEVKAQESLIGAGKGQADAEYYTKQSEAIQKLYDANDKLNDFKNIEIPKMNRQTFDEEIINDIELIRSKKLGADSQIETLRTQINDENTLLAERRKALEDFTKAQKAAQVEETKLLEKFGLKKAEIDDLIATKDAVALAKKIKALENLRLNEAEQAELAKVVLEVQKAELERTAFKNKLDEKAIANQKELARLTLELNKAKIEGAAFAREQELKEKQLDRQKKKDESLSSLFLFSRKKQKQSEAAFDTELESAKQLGDAKQKILDEQYLSERKAIQDQIDAKTKEEAIGLAEIKLLNEKYTNDKLKLDIESAEREKKIEDDKEETARQRRVKRTTDTLENINKVTAAFEQELDKRNALESKQADRAISKQESTIDKQRNLAERGLSNTLAFEEQKREEMELANRDREERNARIQEALQLAQTFNAFLQAALKQTPAPTGVQAITQATTNTFLAKGIAKGLVQFAADGNNMIEGAGTTTSDSIPFMLSKKEAVVKASENIKHNDAVVDLNAGVFGKKWMPIADLDSAERKSTAQNIAGNLAIQNNNEIKQLLTDIKNKPVQMVDVDGLNRLVETVVKDSVKHVTTHVKTRMRV